MDLREVGLGKHEPEPELRALGLVTSGQEDAQRLRVDERGLGQVDDDVDAGVEEKRDLALDPLGRIGVVFALQRDDADRRVLPVERDRDRRHGSPVKRPRGRRGYGVSRARAGGA